MNVPGFRSEAAKRPHCPLAGWNGLEMGVILTIEEGPFAVFIVGIVGSVVFFV